MGSARAGMGLLLVAYAGVLVTDMTGDGDLDVVVGNRAANMVSVLRGDGAGGLGAPESFMVGMTPFAVAAADFNEDGVPDLVTANNGDSTVSVLISAP